MNEPWQEIETPRPAVGQGQGASDAVGDAL